MHEVSLMKACDTAFMTHAACYFTNCTFRGSWVCARVVKFVLHETGTNTVADEGLDDGDHRAENIIFLMMKVTNTIQLFILSSALQTHSVFAQACIRVVADLRNKRFFGGRLFAC